MADKSRVYINNTSRWDPSTCAWIGAWTPTKPRAVATYAAGCWSRHQLEDLAARSAELTHAQPVAPVAPISAGLQALRESLERLVARLYPVAI